MFQALESKNEDVRLRLIRKGLSLAETESATRALVSVRPGQGPPEAEGKSKGREEVGNSITHCAKVYKLGTQAAHLTGLRTIEGIA